MNASGTDIGEAFSELCIHYSALRGGVIVIRSRQLGWIVITLPETLNSRSWPLLNLARRRPSRSRRFETRNQDLKIEVFQRPAQLRDVTLLLMLEAAGALRRTTVVNGVSYKPCKSVDSMNQMTGLNGLQSELNVNVPSLFKNRGRSEGGLSHA